MDEKFLNVVISAGRNSLITLNKITALEYQELLDGLKAGSLFEFEHTNTYNSHIRYLINPTVVAFVEVRDWTPF